jgi:hypothetical protein
MTAHDWFVEHRLEYATRTLEAGDETTFAAHLVGCEECRREVALIEGDLQWLPMALPPAAPRPGLERKIVKQVLAGGRTRRRDWRMPAALAAGALLAVGGWYLGGSRAGALGRELAAERAAATALRDTLSIMRQSNRILQASVEVDGTRGGLLIFADEATHRWNVVIHGLPPAPVGRRYQFWFICAESADRMVPGAAVAADTLRPTIFATDMPAQEACRSVIGAALTEEPGADGRGPPRGRELAQIML